MNPISMRSGAVRVASTGSNPIGRKSSPQSPKAQLPTDKVEISGGDKLGGHKWGSKLGALALAGVITAGAISGAGAAEHPSADGDMIVHNHSNGTKSVQVGDFRKNPDGSLTTRVGNVEITDGKVSAMKTGDTVFHQDGSYSKSQGGGLTVRSNGNSTFVNVKY